MSTLIQVVRDHHPILPYTFSVYGERFSLHHASGPHRWELVYYPLLGEARPIATYGSAKNRARMLGEALTAALREVSHAPA